MNFEEYQKKCEETAIYPKEKALEYTTLGLVGEAGEIANKAKKIIRDRLQIDAGLVNDFKKELGDVLWYIATLSRELGINLDDVATSNLKKLFSRKERGTIGGSGDNR